jgi:CheY-like chemotaxis protein
LRRILSHDALGVCRKDGDPVTAEVLVVDDDPEGSTFARYIETLTRLRTLFTDDVAAVLEIVRDEHVKVVILDQRMEKKSGITGTKLAERIFAVDPRVRCMIFSGQSEKEDVEEAGELRLIYRDKARLEELPQLVHVLRTEYLEELARTTAQTDVAVIGEFRTTVSFGTRVRFELLAVEDVGRAAEAREEDYREIVLLTPAQTTQEYSAKYVDEQEIRIGQEAARQLGVNVALKAPALAELSTSLMAELRRSTEDRRLRRREVNVKTTFSLTQKDIGDGVVACSIQQAALYMRRRGIVRSTCSCCGVQSITGVPFTEWTGRYERRRIDRFGDGKIRIIPLGSD